MMELLTSTILNLFGFALFKDFIFDNVHEKINERNESSGGDYTFLEKYIFAFHCPVCFSIRIFILVQLTLFFLVGVGSILSVLLAYVIIWLIAQI